MSPTTGRQQPIIRPRRSRTAELRAAAIRIATDKRRLTDLALSTLSGCLVFLSFPAYDLWPLLWVSLVPLLFVVHEKRPWQAFGWGFWAGLVTNWGGFWWVTGMLMDFGHFSLAAAIPICTLLCAYQGLVFALWAGLTSAIVQRTRANILWVAPVTWAVVEWTLPFIFPWYFGNGQYKFYAAIQICEVIGVTGLSFLLVLLNTGLYAGARLAVEGQWKLAWREPALVSGIFVLNLIYGVVRMVQVDAAMEAAPKLRIGVGEANVGIFEKEAKHLTRPEEKIAMLRGNILKHHLLAAELEETHKVDLIVEPESSFIPVPWWFQTVRFKRSDLFTVVAGSNGSVYELRDRKWVGPRVLAKSGRSASAGPTSLRSLSAAREDVLLAVGDDGVVQRWDGSEWTAEATPATSTLYGVWAGFELDRGFRADGAPTVAMAVGERGVAIRRDESGTWTATDTRVQSTLRAVTGDEDGVVFAVGDRGTVLRFQSGAWRKEPTDTGVTLHGIAMATDGTPVAVGEQGTLLIRQKGAWKKLTVGEHHLRAIAAEGQQLVAVGDAGTVIEHIGEGWKRVGVPTAVDLLGVGIDGRGDVVIIGKEGVILTRPRGATAFTVVPRLPTQEVFGQLLAVTGVPYTESHAYARDAQFLQRSGTPLPHAAGGDRMAAVADPKALMLADTDTPGEEWNTPIRGFKTPILLGLITYDKEEGHVPMLAGRDARKTYNSAMLIDGDGRVLGRYDKNYLLMFGEYIPLGDRFPQLYEKLPEASHFEAGTTVETFAFRGHQLGIMICYEDIIPRFTRKLAGKDPNVLINVTNDAWFGKTSEPYLHLALAVFRSVENRLWLIRSTNTGVSVFVDAVGRIKSQTRLDDAELLAEDVPMLRTSTPYRSYGDVFTYGCIVVFAVAAISALVRRRPGTIV